MARPELDDPPPPPAGIQRLRTDRHGRPVPWFVHWNDDDTPDFRVIGRGRIGEAMRFGLCWTCGRPRGRHVAFVVGPMCAVNRISAEPPNHLACALYSATHCPFLTTPSMVRRDRNLPEHYDPPGKMITRNPGVALVWSTRTWAPERVPRELGGGELFNIGDPTAVSWWAHGRPATRAEVRTSIDAGLPELRAACQLDHDPARSEQQLADAVVAALALLPDDEEAP